MESKPKAHGRLPAEFRTHLHPEPVEVLEQSAPYIFMTTDQLQGELQALADALPYPSGPYEPKPSLQEAVALGWELTRLSPFGQPPTVDELSATLAVAPSSQSRSLHRRLMQVERAIRHAQHLHGRDFEPTSVFAVNPRWDRRWDALVGGELLPAYIACAAVDQF